MKKSTLCLIAVAGGLYWLWRRSASVSGLGYDTAVDYNPPDIAASTARAVRVMQPMQMVSIAPYLKPVGRQMTEAEYARPRRGLRGLAQDDTQYNFDQTTVIETPGVGQDVLTEDPSNDLHGPLTPTEYRWMREDKYLPPAFSKFAFGTLLCAAAYLAFKGGA
jgi:hypothetical protein